MAILTVSRCIWERYIWGRDKKCMCASEDEGSEEGNGCNETFEMHKEGRHSNLLSVHGFGCYESLQCFAVISLLGFLLPPSRQERLQHALVA